MSLEELKIPILIYFHSSKIDCKLKLHFDWENSIDFRTEKCYEYTSNDRSIQQTWQNENFLSISSPIDTKQRSIIPANTSYPSQFFIHPTSERIPLLSWRKHLTGNIREAFCDSGPASLSPPLLSLSLDRNERAEVWRRRGAQWVGNDSLPRAPETAFSFCRRHRSVSRRFPRTIPSNDALWLRLQIRKGGKKRNRREKRSERNGATSKMVELGPIAG